MKLLLILPFLAQACVMLVDEYVLHRRRGLPRWERIGHPVDTLSVLVCYLFCLLFRPSQAHLTVYLTLAAFSSLLITKDEFVHARQEVSGMEHWLHAVLFVLHPIVFMAAGLLWWRGMLQPLWVQALLTMTFLTYQVLYWNAPWFRFHRVASTTISTTPSTSDGIPPMTTR